MGVLSFVRDEYEKALVIVKNPPTLPAPRKDIFRSPKLIGSREIVTISNYKPG